MDVLIDVFRVVFDIIMVYWNQFLRFLGNIALRDFFDSIVSALRMIRLPF